MAEPDQGARSREIGAMSRSFDAASSAQVKPVHSWPSALVIPG